MGEEFLDFLPCPARTRRTFFGKPEFGALLVDKDEKVMAAFDSAPFSREQMQRWLRRNLEHHDQHGFGLFSVIFQENGLLIGNCGLEAMDVDGAQTCELGYDFRSDYWNRGLATEAAIAVRDYAFEVLRLPQLISLVRVGNIASQRVAEKVGMTRSAEFVRCDTRYWKYGMESPLESSGDG